MPLDIHTYKGAKTPDSAMGNERYATNPDSTTIADRGHFTNAQADALGRLKQRSVLRYKDPTAYFCSACWYVFGVTCPNCQAKSEPAHNRPTKIAKDDPLFEVVDNSYDRKEGVIWVEVRCRKCSYGFKVIKR
jgi:hypothetical protein